MFERELYLFIYSSMLDLSDLRKSCEDRHIPLISVQTQDFLVNRLERNQPKRVLEIWSAVWYSSIVISQTISKRWGTLTSFEISYPAYLEALKNIEKAEINNVVLYPFDINEILLEKFFSQKFDAAFIDAQKSQYWDYLQKIRSHLAPENTLLLDDVIKYQNKLGQLYQFLEKMHINYEILDTEPGDRVMLIESQSKQSWLKSIYYI